MSEIRITTDDPEVQRLWSAVCDLVERLPHGWVLVGGLMVQLHAIERGVLDVRATQDIDVLGQARPRGSFNQSTLRFRKVGSSWRTQTSTATGTNVTV